MRSRISSKRIHLQAACCPRPLSFRFAFFVFSLVVLFCFVCESVFFLFLKTLVLPFCRSFCLSFFYSVFVLCCTGGVHERGVPRGRENASCGQRGRLEVNVLLLLSSVVIVAWCGGGGYAVVCVFW